MRTEGVERISIESTSSCQVKEKPTCYTGVRWVAYVQYTGEVDDILPLWVLQMLSLLLVDLLVIMGVMLVMRVQLEINQVLSRTSSLLLESFAFHMQSVALASLVGLLVSLVVCSIYF